MNSIVERTEPSDPKVTIVETLDTLDALLHGLMALGENDLDGLHRPCYTLASLAHEASDKLRVLCGADEEMEC
jgi:hypothetical protein